jgi:hypothetical protein
MWPIRKPRAKQPPHGGAYLSFPSAPAQFSTSAWNDSLPALFKAAVTHAQDRIDWYDAKSGRAAWWARKLRLFSILFFAAGTGAPLVATTVLKALGPKGILINMARGSVVDEPALIEALKNRTIYSAGLDVFAKEPEVPKELIAMDHIVLFPHLGSSTEVTRAAMDQLVVDNVLAWAAGKPPLTPVSETPFPPKR